MNSARRVLKQRFFNRDTETVAQELLGKFLVRSMKGKEISAMITETEAYDGLEDKASHAFKGKTSRTETMFGYPGIFYVYLVYGMHYMLNIVTREHDYPAAVLIRGVARNLGRPGLPMLNGPGKVTRFLHINRTFNARNAQKASGLWVEDRGIAVHQKSIKKTPRIGVNYAGPIWSAKKRRFVLELNHEKEGGYF